MIQFIHPSWLFASAGIVIPLIIHLWNVREGKVLKVGSIALLMQSDRQQARSIKLKDILLLILRCLLIITLALLLAKPYYRKKLSVNEEKGWILTTRADLQPAYAQHKILIDSLTKAGCSFHYFEPPFASANLADALNTIEDSARGYQDYWALLKALNQQVPADLPLYLFTNDLLKNFRGPRPAVALQLNWRTFGKKDTTATYIAEAYFSTGNNARVYMAESTPTATTVSVSDRLIASLPDSLFRVDAQKIKHPSANAFDGRVSLDTSTLHCVVYTSAYAKDAAYVQAALQSIALYTKRRINVHLVNKTSDLPAQHDWLFWLADQPLPEQHKMNNVVYYAVGKVITQSSGIYTHPTAPEAIPLQRRIADTANNDIPVWVNGYGDNLLSLQQGTANLYKFNSHFNPMWNDMVWSKAFPGIMMDLLYGEAATTIHPADLRRIDPAQMLPVIQQSASVAKAGFTRTIPLEQALWLVAFILFCLERYLSLAQRKEVVYG